MEERIYMLNNQRIQPWSSRCETFRITMNAWINQEKLLVAKDKKQYQEICTRMYQVLIEQNETHEESRKILFIRNTGRTMAGN